MEEEAKNFFKAWLMVVISLCYCYFIASKIPKGMFRFFSLLPIFSLFTTLPLSLSRPLPTLVLSAFISWLSNFKLLLYSFNLGPLSTNNNPQRSSLLRFIFLSAFPIKIKEKSQHPSTKVNLGPNKVVPLNFGSKLVLFVILEVVYHYYKNMVVFCCLMYLFIDVIFGVCDVLVRATLGVELEPPSDEPYLSTSLQDFWGKRWNRMMSDALRHTIYKPVRSMAQIIMGPKWAAIFGVIASFVVSGLMHELIYYYITRVKPTWEVTWFFVLHGVCVVLEMVVKRALGRRWRLHWAFTGPLTIGFVMGTGFWLFFPQIMRNHVDVEATEDIIAFGNRLKEMIRMN